MTILAHDVQAKQPERDRLQADYEQWKAKHGEPVCYGPTVSAERTPDIEQGMKEKRGSRKRV